MLIVIECQIALMVLRAAGRKVNPDPLKLRAYLYIVGVKTTASFAENTLFWLLIRIIMSLIAKRNILLEAPEVLGPIIYPIFPTFAAIFLTNRSTLRHNVHPSVLFSTSEGSL